MKSLAATGVLLLLIITCRSQTINHAEYFFDADPGAGQGVALSLVPGAMVNQTFNIATTSITAGFHTLNTRVRSSTGAWSLFSSRTFFIIPTAITITPATQILKAEYFIDKDPGPDLASAISFTPAASVSFMVTVPTNTLASGFHTVNIRTLDNQRRWSLFGQRTFYIVPPVGNVASTRITKAEYFFNADPGPGKAKPLAITSGDLQSNIFSLDVSGLAPGFHQLGVRHQDERGLWSHFINRTFWIINANTLSLAEIKRLEYFIDIDPAVDSGTKGTQVAISPSANIDQELFIDLSGVAPGTHTVYLRAQDDKGFWSTVKRAEFTVLNCTTPVPPNVVDVARCGEGPVTLTASGAAASQVYRWYEDRETSTVLSVSPAFTTPALGASRQYYVSIFDPATNCESERTSATAEIKFAAKPTITPSGSLSFCEGASVIVSAPPGYSRYTWSTGETTRQIFISDGAQYTVQVGDETCTSAPSDAVDVTVINGPPKPVVSVTGNTVICEAGTVLLSAPDGFNYEWSNGATTQSINVAQTGVYFVRVMSGNDCRSVPSDPVAVTVLAAPCQAGNPNQSPVIAPMPISVPIEGQVEVDLAGVITDPDGDLDYSSLRLVSGTTARGASASIDGSYNLRIDYTGMPFTGIDRITIEICDLAGACVQKVIDIDVAGAVLVYNGLTPDGDGRNDFLLLKYIDVVEGARENRVTIFNRWGDVVFESSNYNNTDRVFNGTSRNGSDLPSGTYFYKIEFVSGIKSLTGFITLKR